MPFERNDVWKNLGFKELTGFLDKRRAELKGVFDAHTVEGQFKMSEDVVKEVRARNDELADATKHWEGLRELDTIFQKTRDELKATRDTVVDAPPFATKPNDGAHAQPMVKSLGELFVASAIYQSALKAKHNANTSYAVELDEIDAAQAIKAALKTTMTTAAGFAPANDRTDRLVLSAQRRPVVADLIPQDPTTLSNVRYMEETTFTNNAAPVAENVSKPESAMAWTERNNLVEVIATYLPVTNQQLDDVPGIRGIIDSRLTLMLQLAEEVQLLSGNGTSPQLLGFYNKPGIQTQAKGADPVPDAIYKAFTKVRHTGFAEPTGVILHPNDWQDIRLLRTVDGIYIWGNPSEAGPERIWGKPIIATTAATENTGLTGDFQLYSHISRRMGITIAVGLVNDDFIKNKQTLRAEERLALEIYRAAAFCLITGI